MALDRTNISTRMRRLPRILLLRYEALRRALRSWEAGLIFACAPLGVIVGANFAVTDGIIVGAEFQGDGYWNGSFSSYDAIALGRVGGFIADNTMLYGDLGTGFKGGTFSYAVGGGAEMALTGPMSVRGDLQLIGGWGAMPSTGRATVGLLWHMN